MKGFMFSIEMLGVITVVIIVVAIMLSFSIEQPGNTSLFELKKTNQAMLLLYENGDDFIERDGDNVYCKDLADYSTDFNKIVTLRYCEAIK